MTAAGVATLFITQDYLHPAQGLDCRGNLNNTHIDAGLKWISDNFARVFADKECAVLRRFTASSGLVSPAGANISATWIGLPMVPTSW